MKKQSSWTLVVAALLATSGCMDADPVADSPRAETTHPKLAAPPPPTRVTPHDPATVGPNQPENVRFVDEGRP
jgi:hypothetical protein